MLTALESRLLVALFVLLMFGMGSRLTLAHFTRLWQKPQAFLLGSLTQFGWMPACAYWLARALHLQPTAAVGMIVLASCPAGATSNLFAHWARADVALSVSMTASSKLLGIPLLPLSLYLYARPFTDTTLQIPYLEVVKTLLGLAAPVALAMVLRARLGERFGDLAARIGSAAGGGALILLIVVGISQHRERFLTLAPSMYIAAALFGALGMTLGACGARLFRLPEAQLRTVSFESGVPNPPLCLAILLGSFREQADVSMLALPLLCQLFTLIEACLLVVWFRSRDRVSYAS